MSIPSSTHCLSGYFEPRPAFEGYAAPSVKRDPPRRLQEIPAKASGWVGPRPVGRMGWRGGSLVDVLSGAPWLPVDRISASWSQAWGYAMNAHGKTFNDIPLCADLEPAGTVLEEYGLWGRRYVKLGDRYTGRTKHGGRGSLWSIWVDEKTGKEVSPQTLVDAFERGDIHLVSRPAQVGIVW